MICIDSLISFLLIFTLGGASDILSILREQVSEHVVKVPVFNGAADLILESTLKSRGRTLTSEQKSAILEVASSQPLLLRLLALKSLEWRSDYKVCYMENLFYDYLF